MSKHKINGPCTDPRCTNAFKCEFYHQDNDKRRSPWEITNPYELDESKKRTDCSWTKKDRCYHPELYKTKDCDNSCDFKIDTHFCAFIHESDKQYLKDLDKVRFQVMKSFSKKQQNLETDEFMRLNNGAIANQTGSYLKVGLNNDNNNGINNNNNNNNNVEESSESMRKESFDDDSSSLFVAKKEMEIPLKPNKNKNKNKSNQRKKNEETSESTKRESGIISNTTTVESSEETIVPNNHHNGSKFKLDHSEHSSDEYDFQSDIGEREYMDAKKDEKNEDIDAEEGSSLFKSNQIKMKGSSGMSQMHGVETMQMKTRDKLKSILPLFAGEVFECSDGYCYRIERIMPFNHQHHDGISQQMQQDIPMHQNMLYNNNNNLNNNHPHINNHLNNHLNNNHNLNNMNNHNLNHINGLPPQYSHLSNLNPPPNFNHYWLNPNFHYGGNSHDKRSSSFNFNSSNNPPPSNFNLSNPSNPPLLNSQTNLNLNLSQPTLNLNPPPNNNNINNRSNFNLFISNSKNNPNSNPPPNQLYQNHNNGSYNSNSLISKHLWTDNQSK